MSILPPKEAYRLWASTYEAGNALTELERALVAELGPPATGRRLLDAGCGTGWRLRNAAADIAIGIDISPEMLAEGRRLVDPAAVQLLNGDVRALPFADEVFDLVWCRLVMGYVPELAQVYRELARVTEPGGSVIVTDFHPLALAAGQRRTFRHGDEVHELLTYPHSAEEQIRQAMSAGLTLRRQADARVGPEVREFYVRAGREAQYAKHRGEAVVLGLAFVRDG